LLSLQLTAEDLANFERAAATEGESVQTWAAETLRRAVADD
jgi:hypothetical protein